MPVEVELPLELRVETVQVSQGRLRITATMHEGSPDVSMWLAPPCEEREIGRGIATDARFVWTLTSDELARALECSLKVRARGIRGEGVRLRKVAELPVELSVGGADEDDAPRMQSHSTEGALTNMVFANTQAFAPLHVGHVIVGREFDPSDDDDHTARFLVPTDGLARAVLARWPLSLQSSRYLAEVTVGGVNLEADEAGETITLSVDDE